MQSPSGGQMESLIEHRTTYLKSVSGIVIALSQDTKLFCIAERIVLLIHLLRSGLARVADLELSTASIMAWITYERFEILRELCLVGRADEHRRQNGKAEGKL